MPSLRNTDSCCNRKIMQQKRLLVSSAFTYLFNKNMLQYRQIYSTKELKISFYYIFTKKHFKLKQNKTKNIQSAITEDL